jgi:hypothetical protein
LILPTTVESDLQTDEPNADIRKEADTLVRLVPNEEPIARMNMQPDAAEAEGSVELMNKTVAGKYEWCNKQPCPNVTVRVKFPVEIDALAVFVKTKLVEIQWELSELECENLDDKLLYEPGISFPMTISKLDAVSGISVKFKFIDETA